MTILNPSKQNTVDQKKEQVRQLAAQTDGTIGVRDRLVQMGLENDRIGWNQETGAVTYNGMDILKPSSVVNGTSYAPEKDIYSAYMKTGNRDGVVVATDYAANQLGIDNAVTWRDGKVAVGGRLIEPVAIVDGKALVPTDQMEEALKQYRNSTGLSSNRQVYEQWKGEYGQAVQKALDQVMNREQWSYDPEKDPSYQAYRQQYEREGNRAYQNALASAMAGTGGYLNSAALTAGGQQLGYYMQQLNDQVPELMKNDYNRYLGEQQLLENALKSILNVSNEDYNKRYAANRDTIEDLKSANNANAARDQQAKEWQYKSKLYDNQLQKEETEQKYYEQSLLADLEKQLLSNQEVSTDTLLKLFELAYKRGNFTPEEAKQLEIPGQNGDYRSPYYGDQRKYEEVERPKIELNAEIDRLLAMDKIQANQNAQEFLLRLKAMLG